MISHGHFLKKFPLWYLICLELACDGRSLGDPRLGWGPYREVIFIPIRTMSCGWTFSVVSNPWRVLGIKGPLDPQTVPSEIFQYFGGLRVRSGYFCSCDVSGKGNLWSIPKLFTVFLCNEVVETWGAYISRHLSFNLGFHICHERFVSIQRKTYGPS